MDAAACQAPPVPAAASSASAEPEPPALQLSDAEETELRAVFTHYDIDGNGEVTMDEMTT